jgi:hypothetical protein
MDIKTTAGSFVALDAALFFGSGTPLAEILLADVNPWLIPALSYRSEPVADCLGKRNATCFKCASFTFPTELESRRGLDF